MSEAVTATSGGGGGSSGPPSAVPASGNGDDISIVIGTNKVSGWLTASITCSAEIFPRSFIVTLTEEFSNDPGKILANPGERITVFIGDDVVITGYVDSYRAGIRPGAHDVEITGRGLCEDLVDCSCDLLSPDSPVLGGSISAANALDLAQKLCKPFAIRTRCAVADLGKAIPTFQIALGETPYEAIESVARYTGYLVYEDETGALVLDRVGTMKMASGFAQGVNVEAASSSLSVEQRFTTITIVFSTVDMTSEGAGVNVANKRASVTDTAFTKTGRHRPRIVVSSQTDNTPDFAQRMANWELARRIGRSQAVHLTCDSWRDSAGKLWQPNYLAKVNLPALKLVNVEWLIATVTFRKDASGTHADVTLMPPDAFSIEPSTLNIFDPELNVAVPKSQDPAPPSTSPTGYTPGAVPRGDG